MFKQVLFLICILSFSVYAEEICPTNFIYGKEGSKLFEKLKQQSDVKRQADVFKKMNILKVEIFEHLKLDKFHKYYDDLCGVYEKSNTATKHTVCVHDEDSRFTRCRVSCGLNVTSKCDYY